MAALFFGKEVFCLPNRINNNFLAVVVKQYHYVLPSFAKYIVHMYTKMGDYGMMLLHLLLVLIYDFCMKSYNGNNTSISNSQYYIFKKEHFMEISRDKVVIIGAGIVGTTIAYSLVVQEVCAEITLIDLNETKALGEAMDLQHGIEYFGRNVKIKSGTYADCKDADIVVLTASAPYSGEMNRIQMMDKSASIVKAIVPKVMESGFDGIIVVVTNPVDIISYMVYKLSGLPKNQIIGTGTAIETARLKQHIGQVLNIDPRNIEALVLGEHGDSLFVPWSIARASGKNLMDIIKDNPEYNSMDLSQIEESTRKAGFDVLGKKGNTQYGIASVATGIISAVLRDEYRAIPVSTLLEGEYGITDAFCGVPAILNRYGVVDVVELHLTEQEQKSLEASIEVIKDNIKKLGL